MGLDAFEMSKHAQKYVFSSRKSSFEVDWWYVLWLPRLLVVISNRLHALNTIKRDLDNGDVPKIPLLCTPIETVPTTRPSISVGFDFSHGHYRRRPELPSAIQKYQRFTVYETKKV